MSRTDKDRPGWVRAELWEPRHVVRCPHSPWRRAGRACDLPPEPVRRYPSSEGRRVRGCHWQPVDQRRPVAPTPAWYVPRRWTDVERRSVRDDCRRAVAEYRATGEIHVEPSTRQHHHCATWWWE